MNADAIREVLRRVPFEPFELRMSNGEVHQVGHPEFAIVTSGRLIVADPITDRLEILSMIQIVEIRSPQRAA